jgi:hypothetical protein
MSDSMLACITACQACVNACERCVSECLEEDHVQTMTKCIRLARDCADVCRLAIGLMGRDSAYAKQICALCSDVSEACSVECARHKEEQCRQCAEACRRCAEVCRKVAA